VTIKIVEVGTNVPYASLHNFGGVSKSEKISGTVRKNLWAWLKKQNKDLKGRLGWLLNRKFKDQKLEQKVPKRQFVGVTLQTRKAIKKTIGVEIMEVGR
jgi:phage gpG-like protein